MSDWVSWNELLNQGINSFDLLEYLKEGFQPYSRPNKPVFCLYEYHRYNFLNKKYSRFNNLITTLNYWIYLVKEGTEVQLIRLDDYLEKSIEKYNREAIAEYRVQIHDHVFIDIQEQFENLIKFKHCLEKKREETLKEMEDIVEDDPNLNEDQKKLSWKYLIIPDSEEEYKNIILKLENAFFKKGDLNRFVKKKDVGIGKKPKHSQRCREKSREVAERIWKNEISNLDPITTIT